MSAGRQALADALAAYDDAETRALNPDPRWSTDQLALAHLRRIETGQRLLGLLRDLLAADPQPEPEEDAVLVLLPKDTARRVARMGDLPDSDDRILSEACIVALGMGPTDENPDEVSRFWPEPEPEHKKVPGVWLQPDGKVVCWTSADPTPGNWQPLYRRVPPRSNEGDNRG